MVEACHYIFSRIVSHGEDRLDGTRRLFGASAYIPLNETFPCLPQDETRLAFENMKWMLSGETDVRPLAAKGVTAYDKKVIRDHSIGANYGFHLRHFGGTPFTECPGGFDQVHDVLRKLRETPESRNIVMSMFDPSRETPSPTYVTTIQFSVSNSAALGQLHCIVNMRSTSIHVLPFNVTMFAFMVHMFARAIDLLPGSLTVQFGDVHIPKHRSAEEKAYSSPHEWKQWLFRGQGFCDKPIVVQNMVNISFEDFKFV